MFFEHNGLVSATDNQEHKHPTSDAQSKACQRLAKQTG